MHGLEIDESDTKPVSLGRGAIAKFAIKRDDVFVVRGNGSKHLVGRSAIARADRGDVVFNDLLIRLRFKAQMLPEFANLVLHSRDSRMQVESLAKTAAGIWKINQTNLGLLKLPCPSVQDQIDFVRSITVAKDATEHLFEEIGPVTSSGLREAVLRQAFAGEL